MLLETLFPEILDEIFEYLRVRELKNLARTNSSYNHALKQLLYCKLAIPLHLSSSDIRGPQFYCPEVFINDQEIRAITNTDIENSSDGTSCKSNSGAITDTEIKNSSDGTSCKNSHLTDEYFEFVEVLEVDGYHLSYPLFLRSVTKCTNLKRLTIKNETEHLQGDAMQTVFENLTTLKTLEIQDSILLSNSGLEHIHRLIKLEELTLHNCRSFSDNTGVLSHLSTLSPHLRKLDLSYCSSLGTDVCITISNLLVLEELILKECLYIPDEGLVHVGKLCKLQVLDLSSCGGTFGSMTVDGLVHISRLPSLRELHLLDWMLTDDQFSAALSMTTLSRLTFGPALAFTVVENTDSVAHTISKMDHLQCLELVNCYDFTGDGYRLISMLPLLTELNLLGCGMTEGALESISMMSNLKVLSLNGCRDDTQGNDTIFKIAKLNSLQKLHMRQFYAVTDNFLGTLHDSLPQLTELDVSYCGITDEGLQSISMIRGLERLWLYKCREISDLGLQHVSRMPALTYIMLGGHEKELVTREGITCLKKINSVHVRKQERRYDEF